MIRANFHTHTKYCDGKDTPEELIKKALELKFSALGFSGHSFTPFDTGYCMSPESEKAYIVEISELKQKYDGKIDIFCGIEQDIYSEILKESYDYIIGSVHYIKINNNFLPVDLSCKKTAEIVKTYFSGDFDLYAKAYFETVSEVVEKTDCDIIGHIDLISKFDDVLGIRHSDRYFYFAEDAVKKISREQRIFEVNTGAVARGLRKAPYPAVEILKMIFENNGSVILNSDCHDKEFLDCCFDESEKIIKSVGFNEIKMLTKKRF